MSVQMPKVDQKKSMGEEFSFDGPSSFKLLGRIWRPSGNCQGTVFGCHGYTEHSGRYHGFAKFLNERDYALALFDLPGHGLSNGRRANIDRFEDYVGSLANFFTTIKQKNLPGPYYLFGHSLGGLIGIRFLETRTPNDVVSAAFTCPLLGLSTHAFHGVGKFVQNNLGAKILEVVCGILPNISIPNTRDLGGSILTHDPEEVEERERDPLIRPMVTLRWTSQFLGAVQKAFAERSNLKIPVGIFRSGDDRVVSVLAQERFVEGLAGPHFLKTYEGMWHELLNETIKDQVREEILSWLLRGSR